MENIQLFLNFCENYGVPKTGLFQTVDLFEGRNLPQVLNCIQQLGTEVSRGCVITPEILSGLWFSRLGSWSLDISGLSSQSFGLSLSLERLSLCLGLDLGHQHQSATSIKYIHLTLLACSYRSLLLNFDGGLLFRK